MMTKGVGIVGYPWYNGNSSSNNNWNECKNADSGNVITTCCPGCTDYDTPCSGCSTHNPPDSWAGDYLPDKGIYASDDSVIIYQQIQEIKNIGCEFVALSYWGSQKPQTVPAYQTWNIVMSSTPDPIKICPYYEDASYKQRSISTVEADITNILNITGNNIYTMNGKPVIFAYGPSSDSTYLNRWNTIRTYLANHGTPIFLIQKGSDTDGSPLNHSLADLYCPYQPADRLAYAGIDAIAISPRFGRYHCRPRLDCPDITGDWAGFEQNVITFYSSNAKIKLIETYNEWQECTGIEPATLYNHLEGPSGPSPKFTPAAVSYGTTYIDIFAKYFNPCSSVPTCVFGTAPY